MHALRTSSILARLLLVWFVLTLGVAVASPLVAPKAMEIVCSASGGVKMVMTTDSGDQADRAQHTLDCAMCLAITLPPPQTHTVLPLVQPLAHALRPVVAARIAALVGAPLPARGPPSLFV